MKLSDFVIKFLEQKKIDTVFTVSGGGSIFLCDSFIESAYFFEYFRRSLKFFDSKLYLNK